ncbi:DUF1206 domain-containing protein [Pseudalkalibacillus decolorationis]|uniref:DUF1206 domain-containing protein n=1 Tax=Pseudalkalibacillus decolorationis TaxID=163879 RepID=UPI0021493F11|nr:DUF1206 domain-containing protein [Pseudalkalibacillus decolorationis]
MQTNPLVNSLLWVLAAGLLGYAGWQLIQTIYDPDQKGRDMVGIVTRIGYFISGMT